MKNINLGQRIKLSSAKGFMEEITGLWAVLVLLVAFSLINSAFLNSANIKNLFGNLATLLIMASGATLVRFVGSLDLSMGSVCSVSNVLLVILFPSLGAGAYLAALGFGAFAGLLLGLVHTKFKIPSFIASLGFMNIWTSAALLITASPISIGKKYAHLIAWSRVSFGPINMATIISLAAMVLLLLFQSYTSVGRSLKVIGGNERAARIIGIRIDRCKIIAFTICGFTSAVCGVMLAVKLRSCAPTVGNSFTLLAVASVLLGGTSASGGRGSVFKTLLGSSIAVIIQNGMTIIGVDAFWTQIVFGSLVLVSIILTSDRSGKNLVVK